jgi:hypothetical protein
LEFGEISWLLGEWTDIWRRGEPGEATAGGESWGLQVGEQILVRNSWCEYPATRDHPAFRHDDLMIVFHDVDMKIRAVFWDNHGHVIRYTTVTIDPGRAEFSFESDPSNSGPQQRLHYHADGANRLGADFNLKLPGAETFSQYLEWTSSRSRPVQPTTQ